MLLSKWKHILHFLKILSTADLAIVSGDDTTISTETSSKKAKTYKRLASVPPGVCPGSEGVLYRDHWGLARAFADKDTFMRTFLMRICDCILNQAKNQRTLSAIKKRFLSGLTLLPVLMKLLLNSLNTARGSRLERQGMPLFALSVKRPMPWAHHMHQRTVLGIHFCRTAKAHYPLSTPARTLSDTEQRM
ncbi:hypothetical protein [Zymobacter palmae]|uniref:hypothetical protein n=1 Tax=Zymobacter palmae TaxID=33074 RepID=UPI0012EC20C0|nr:hypothetical protein [Zymobacter palmae]